MARTKASNYSNFIDVVNEFIDLARSRGIVHQFTEDESLDGRLIKLNGRELVNFGSCSYLGLETDERLKEAAIDAVRRYGSQFSSSRTYTSFTLYGELEELLNEMFGANVILSTTSTMGHRAVMPILIDDNDAMIFDHQAHISMQDAGKELVMRGVSVSLLRHNRLDELEEKIQALAPKHQKIWYFLDGVYSMYGDLAPLNALTALLDKYKNLHLYIDDAHGMSWAGKNGTGYTLSQVKLSERIVLCSSLAKAFASAGGVFVFADKEQYKRIKNWGGPLTYSGPQQPAVVGASIASAKIHLSPEIYQRQNALAENISYCNKIAGELNLPLIARSQAPIFFIGLGAPKVAYNMNERLMKDGLHVNLGIYPAVPETCTGIRFALTLHHTKEDIDKLFDRVNKYLPVVLSEEQKTMEDIYRAFRSMPGIKEQRLKYESQHNASGPTAPKVNETQPELILEFSESINSVNEKEWNDLFADKGSFDWQGLALLESVFKDNKKPEENWSFHYYIVRDSAKKIVLATFFTSTITKDDMLAESNVSKEIEKHRATNKYYLTSKTLMMGTLLTDGDHLYIDTGSNNWKNAMQLLLENIWNLQDKLEAKTLLLRDFADTDSELKDFLIDQGFVKIKMEDSHVLDLSGIKTREDFITSLSQKKRAHLKRDVLEFEKHFEVSVAQNASDADIDQWYALYEKVKRRNLVINDFKLPKKLFKAIAQSKNWQIILLKLKPETAAGSPQTVAVGLVCKNRNYSPGILGLNYEYLSEYKVYKQMLFQVILKAIESGCEKVYMGLTASLEKRKMGAAAYPKVAYVQIKDNYNLSVMELLRVTAKSE